MLFYQLDGFFRSWNLEILLLAKHDLVLVWAKEMAETLVVEQTSLINLPFHHLFVSGADINSVVHFLFESYSSSISGFDFIRWILIRFFD